MWKEEGIFKLQKAYDEGPVLGLNNNINGPDIKKNPVKLTPPGLFGKATETTVILEGKQISSLLDTGSTVSTISESYYKRQLSDQIQLHKIESILEIECAGGTQLPYTGFIEVNITTPSSTNYHAYPVLVVPDSQYNQHVPLLIGTNILENMIQDLQQTYGERYLQQSTITVPWYLTWRSIGLREKELRKHKNRLAIIRNAEPDKITIPPNTTMEIHGYCDKELMYNDTPAVQQSTNLAFEPNDIDVEPRVQHYSFRKNKSTMVQLSNVTTRTITIPPKGIICELQPVTIQPTPVETNYSAKDTTLLDKMEFTQSSLSEEQLQEGKDLILDYHDIFSKGDTDLGHTNIVQHRIDLLEGGDVPFKQRYRRIPPAMYEEVKDHIRQLMNAGVIRPSHSPWASNVVLVKKKDNSLRMCTDYRMLNQRSKRDSYALPRVEELLDCLSGNKFFSTIDLKSGYHQVEIYEDHKERTAFCVGPLGFYEFNRMPFGLTNSPATFQRLMETILVDLNLRICCVFIDDIIIFGKDYEDHLKNIQLVFDRIRSANLKLSAKKCEFFKRKVKFVGHIVSESGIEIDPAKTEKVENWPHPKTPEDVRRFLGFVGYYRRFIKNFSRISRPLTDLIPTPHKKKQKGKPKNRKEWTWEKPEEDAFQELKNKLLEQPILAYADYSIPFELHVDASGEALGAVLYQEQEGLNRVISYASRGLNKAEKNYPPHKREFLALKWAVCDKFKDYLYGREFVVLTDNNPVTYVLTTAKLDATGHRWLAALGAYKFEIRYRPGRNNADADALSRIPENTISSDSVQAICSSIQPPRYVENLAVSPDVLAEEDLSATDLQEMVDWTEAQAQDRHIKQCIEYLQSKKTLSKTESCQNPLSREYNRLQIIDGVLYRVATIDNEERQQLVLPTVHIPTVLNALHNDMGHPGRDRTLSLLRDRFYWPGMYKDVEEWINQCGRCLRRKSATNQRAPLVPIATSAPLELVCMDFLTLERSKGGYQHILVITDHFTRYAQAVPTTNQLAKTTAAALYNNFIVHYGIPERIHSDQGANFEGKIIQELCQIMGMKKSRTTSYHPMGNGMCERFNRTLLNMLGSLEQQQKENWKAFVGPMVHAYNSTRHESTGQTPYLLMFGRNPRLPIDVTLGLRVNEKQPNSKCIAELKDSLTQAYQLAKESAEKARQKQKGGYDTKIRGAIVKPGDRVLVKKLAFDGKHKLADRWEEHPYTVKSQPNTDIPVYVVRQENGEGRERTLHRNKLLPVGTITDKPIPAPRNTNKRLEPAKRKTRQTARNRKMEQPLPEGETTEDESEVEFLVNQGPVISDITITEQQQQQQQDQLTETDDVEADIGDAHNSDDTDQSIEEETASEDNSIRSASEDLDETVQEDTPESDESHHEEVIEHVQPEPVPVRRSHRERREPAWFRSGEFDMSKSAITTSADWEKKISCIVSLSQSNLFSNLQAQAGQAILDIITRSHTDPG